MEGRVFDALAFDVDPARMGERSVFGELEHKKTPPTSWSSVGGGSATFG